MKKLLTAVLILSLLVFTFVACSTTSDDAYDKSASTSVELASKDEEEVAKTIEVEEETSLVTSLILATTTSTRDSGLLDYILEDFTSKTGIEVKVVAVGTGKALQMGRDGEADVLLVHAKASEEEFVAEGYGTERYDVMYNDFILVGPKSDPADLLNTAPNDIILGFKRIYESKSKFVSRGDDSGTNKKEIALWTEADIVVSDEDFYYSAGKGMGDVLLMSDELQAYTLTDRASYLNMQNKLDLEIVLEKDDRLFNQYGVIPVNPDLNEMINKDGALSFVDWLLSTEVQEKIASYGLEKFGMPLFTPNAN